MTNPITLFKENWDQTKAAGDENAAYCFMATVSADGCASVRTLVLREVTDDSFVVFIDGTSPKWRDLQSAESCELLIFWPTLFQQYRVQGKIDILPAEVMENHWMNKPYEVKLLDHFYADNQPQSSVLPSRDNLLQGLEQLKEKYPASDDVPFPGNAKGIAVKAQSIEVWVGSKTGDPHDRSLYTWAVDHWVCNTLVP